MKITAPLMKNFSRLILLSVFGVATIGSTGISLAGYKARNWSVNARESYPASLTSEGVTIAVEPLFTDALAARVFDKDDIVTRGIMPLAIVIFNDNDFPVEVDALSVELIQEEDHIRTLTPKEAVNRIYKKDKFRPGQSALKIADTNALRDFDEKFLMDKVIAPHSKGGGFLYLQMLSSRDLATYLSSATIYIPNVYRQDNGSRLIFFEIGLRPAVQGEKRP
jgi:hypothetical protein